MKLIPAVAAVLLFALHAWAAQPDAAALESAFQKISIDPEQTYRVRDLQFSRGDIKIYLNEGVLGFATPLAGHMVAAIFTVEGSEGGDGEILLLPPQRSERASLAMFAKTPNLDEHCHTMVFLFSDNTAQELLSQIETAPVRKAPEVATQNAAAIDHILRAATSEAGIQLMESLLDNHQPDEGFFYAFAGGRELGNFEIFYEPSAPEPISIGRAVAEGGRQMFQLWTAFRPRHATAAAERSPVLSDYRIDTTIRPDLSMAATAGFRCVAGRTAGRVLAFGLSEHLRVKLASVDGKNAEIFQPPALHLTEQERGRSFLLISKEPLEAGVAHQVEVRYEGSVIHQTGRGGYFVDERNIWYPYVPPMRTHFDLRFRFAPQLTLVSTGEPVSDEVEGGVRVVHRKTRVPEGLAGFNLGDYKSSTEEHGLYRVESYIDEKTAESLETVAQKTAAVLDDYTRMWTPLPIHSIAVTPIEGTFGQGFPGLIYLSTFAYLRPGDRPALLQSGRVDTFFSEMLLPHEVAHQWWGNVVIPSDYRTGWLVEAMANDAALKVLEHTQGPEAARAVLESYRSDLMEEQNGRTVESFGPVDFGVRLLDMAGLGVWHKVIYEKGSWILHMLEKRLGEEGFGRMQLRLLKEFADKPLTNEAFRRVLSEFVPAGQPDKNLALFFDTWVYGTGIPRMSLRHSGDGQTLTLAGVDEDFTVDVPLQCRAKSGKEEVRWLRASSGSNPIEGRGACELPKSTDFLYSR